MLSVRGLFLPLRTLALAASEIVLISIAIYLSAFSIDDQLLGQIEQFGISAQFAVVLAGVTSVVMLALGLYSRDVLLDYRAMLGKILLAFALEAPVILAATLFYKRTAWPGVDLWSLWYFKVIFTTFACLLVTRAAFLLIADTDALKRRVVIVGAGERAAQIQRLTERAVGCNFIAVAYVAAPTDRAASVASSFRLDAADATERLAQFIRRCGASEIVIAADDRRGLPVGPLLGCKTRGIPVTEFLSFCERESGRVDLAALEASWLIFSDGFRMTRLRRAVKRVFDVAVSLAMLLLTLPLLLLAALAIKLEDGGPVFYAQERVGLLGQRFTLYKFRSMRVDAEGPGGPQWAARGDARVTGVGSIIRKVRIDELPQLFNVLLGDMSFIGPRPERPYFVAQLAPRIPFYGERHAVKPGITGWAQINHPYGASFSDAQHKLSFDLYYVKNHTLLLDLIILIQTVRVILFPQGAR